MYSCEVLTERGQTAQCQVVTSSAEIVQSEVLRVIRVYSVSY
jgi:hypothetical protein